jgi:aspartate ammonia-lyase
MRQLVEHSIGILTALLPELGYEKATGIAREALETGKGVYEIVLKKKLLTKDRLDALLNPTTMVGEKA